jgi:hypothetical protein
MMGLIGGDRIGRSRSDRRRISMAWRTTTAGCTLMFVLLALGSATAADPLADEFFERDVRPLLADRCLKCHGPQKQKGGLRLYSRASILQGGETGPAAVPGKPAESLLIDAVNYGETVQMPPKSRLPADEVATLTRWVATGMHWPAGASGPSTTPAKNVFDLKARRDSHWSWKPVRSSIPPPVIDASWPADSIDRFLLARLEAKGIRPAPDADCRTLIRRLSFDLTGLPPSPEQVEAFVNDPAPGAMERVVDCLLGSPRFGERWGRHWLDLVRYAETRGHEFDPVIPNAYQYRDYVVRALNNDVPYDQFVTEHIAGDLVDPPRVDPVQGANESILGTGFWFLGEEVHSPVDVRQDETDRIDNRLDVMTKTFLGLTVACARCHDHKFDAISQRDYYALTGFLISSDYRQVRFATIERERRAIETLQTLRDAARTRVLSIAARAVRPEIERLAHELTRAETDGGHPLHSLASGIKAGPSRATEPERIRLLADFGREESLTPLQDGFAFGLRPVRPGDLTLEAGAERSPFRLATRASARRERAFRGLTLAKETERDHGRLGTWERAGQTLRTPEFAITSGKLWYLARGAGRAYAAVNSHHLIAGPLHAALLTEWTDGDKGWRWVHHDLTAYAGNRAHIEFSPSGAADLEVARVVESDREPSPVAPPIPTINGSSPEALASSYQVLFREVVRRMETDSLACSDVPEGYSVLADWLIGHLDAFGPAGVEARNALHDEAARLSEAENSLARQVAAPSPTAPAMLDGSGVNEYLLIRGSSKTPGPEVPRRFLEAIAGDAPPGHALGSGRLTLARQMLAPSNPFTARVIVNRVWHHLFGRGIVATVDNLGVLGEPPTHPELLDHLADRFVRDGWSLKRLVRTLVLTRAYRMSSRPDSRSDSLDPDNRLLHRMAIRRLEAEPIRDAILAVSGQLDDRMYGPSVAVHLTPFMQGRGRPTESGPVDGDGRRSLYLAIRRNFLAPMMLAFDAPIPFTTMGRRNVSNVPAQALILMNDPFVIEQAGRWAAQVVARVDSAEARIDGMYRSAFGRSAERAEVADALAFLESQGRELALPAEAWRNDRRVWADLAHVLFNAKEFVFLD